ncbi:MAG: hypothetical protein JWN61_2966 [Pseudonocardiales bacterium]|nr:hypothetical protein [Pseudonocardiales bacterium]
MHRQGPDGDQPGRRPALSTHLSAATARRIALAAQGFDRPRSGGRIDRRHLRRLIDQIGILQLDSVNVLVPSHYLPVFSRLGPYSRTLLDEFAWGPDKELFEYWMHMASLAPLRTQPSMRWRMARVHTDAWGGISAAGRHEERVAAVLAAVERLGPARGGEIEAAVTAIDPTLVAPRAARPAGDMWNWDDTKRSLEFLFYTGQITASARVHFQRLYDLTERVLPPAITATPTPTETDAQIELTRIAARAMGIATEPDLRDYFRLKPGPSRAAIAALVESGELLEATVEGWRAPAYLVPGAARPRRVAARALLSPFDSLIWFRDRALRIFDFHFRLEIYTPKHKRVHGYYVLPFLMDERIVARVDVAADRRERRLVVHAAHAEADADHDATAAALALELETMGGWLGLDGVVVGPGGDLSAALSRAVAQRG